MSNTALLGSYGAQDSSGLMFRNVLVNGCFRVWQRGTSQTSSGYGSDDRWVNDHSGSTKTHSQQTFTLGQTDVPGNPIYFSRTVVTSVAGASNFVLKTQRIESVRTFSGQTATLSFWAKADAPKNMAIEFVQSFGTGGSPSAAVTAIGVTTCALTASWKQFTITVSVPSISGKTLGTADDGYLAVNFWFDGGSAFNARTNSLGQQSGTFDIAMVQLEAGPTATPFERRPYSVELSMCQRYCYQLTWKTDAIFATGLANSTTEAACIMFLPVTLRSHVIALEYGNLGAFAVRRQSFNTIVLSNLGPGNLTENTIWLTASIGSSGLVAGEAVLLRWSGGNSSTYIRVSAEL